MQKQPKTSKKPKTRTDRTQKPTPTQRQVIAIATGNPTLTTREIGKLADCDHSNVIRTLRRYSVDKGLVESYKEHRADIIAGMQHRLLSSVTDDDIKKTPLGSRVMAVGILYDKERLERGMSTANTASIHADIASLQDSTKV